MAGLGDALGACLLLCAAACLRTGAAEAVVALQVAGTVASLALLVLSVYLQREPFADLALVLSVLSWAGDPRVPALPGAAAVRAAAGDVLVLAGAAVAVVSSLGVLVMRSAYDRLHYSGPLVLSAVLIAAAILVRHGWSLIADKALLTAAFLLVAGPVVTQASGRAFRAGEHGDWRTGIGEEIEIEQEGER